MPRLTFAHREYRRFHDGSRYVAVFFELWDGVCRYTDCGKRGYHEHRKEVGDLSAAELLSLDENAFAEAFEDLHHFDSDIYSDTATARLELLREAEEDDGKARDDRGRKVA